MTSPISFISTTPDSADAPVSFTRKAPVDPSTFLPEQSQVRLSMLRLAKANTESALSNAVEAGLPDNLMGGLKTEKAASAANLRSVEEYISHLRAPVEAAPPADVKGQTLDGIRKSIADTEARMTQLQTMRINKLEQIDRLTTTVKALAANCAFETHRLARDTFNAVDPGSEFLALLGHKGSALALLAAVAGDKVIDTISSSIPDDQPGQLTTAERKEAIATCSAELLKLGYMEQTLIREASNPPLQRSTALAPCLLGVK